MGGASDLMHQGLRSVLLTALDAVCVMDANGVIIAWNAQAEEIFGWSEAEAVGSRLSQLIVPPALREAHEQGLNHFLATGEGPVLDTRIEVPALHREGHEFPVELSITASRQFGDLCFVGFLRDISERQAAIERTQRLLEESDHRVKNMLTVVSAIAHQTARGAQDLDSFLQDFSGRIDALAQAHKLLVDKRRTEVALSTLAEQVLGADVAEGRARFGGPELLLPPVQVLGLSMILHELHTNAIKYGALCTETGHLQLDWNMQDDEVEMVWSEQGQPCHPDLKSSGFGQRMIAMAVKSDLGGTIEREWNQDGLVAKIRFPLAA